MGDKRGPAGVSSSRTLASSGRRKSGKNVEAFLSREAEIHRAVEYTQQNERQTYKAAWEENQVKKLSQNGKAQKQKEYVLWKLMIIDVT